MRIITLYFIFVLIPLSAQPTLQWQKSYGGSKDDGGSSIQKTIDNGYVAVGYTFSTDGDVTSLNGASDIWIVKIDEIGTIQWQKTFGGSSFEESLAIRQTNDGGFIFGGSTLSNNGDVSGNHGSWDYWVVKIDTQGGIQWQRTLGGSLEDRAYDIQITSDGGYVVAGYSHSSDGDVTGNHGDFDYWVVKLNSEGNIVWQKTYGGTGWDEAYSIIQTSDEGYAVMGATYSNDGDVSGNHGPNDYWVVKIDSVGELEWQRALGGSGADDGRQVIQTSDGGYLVGGREGSGDGQIEGDYLRTDFWVVKLDVNGNFQWQKPLGGNDEDFLTSMAETENGNYMLGGVTYSTDGDVVGNEIYYPSIWLLEINEQGQILWQKTMGGLGFDVLGDIELTDAGFVMVCITDSNEGDVSGNHGKYDMWIVKLSFESSPTTETTNAPLEIYPNPATQSISVSIHSETSSFDVIVNDLLGREVLRQARFSNGSSLQIAQLPTGIYAVKAVGPSGKTFAGKFKKE